MIKLEITNDQADEVVRQTLIDSVDMIEDEALQIHMKYVIAYFSVPGTYENGRYDIT